MTFALNALAVVVHTALAAWLVYQGSHVALLSAFVAGVCFVNAAHAL